MNKVRLHLKLEKLLPADKVEFVYNSIISCKHFDRLVDVHVVNGDIKCFSTPWSPRENLKRAIRYYFENSCPMEMTTYTKLDNLAGACKKDFDKVVIEALHDMISDLEDL